MNIYVIYTVFISFLMYACVCRGQSTNVVKKPQPQTNREPQEIILRDIPLNQPRPINSVGDRFEFYLNNRLDTLSKRKVHPFNTMTKLLTAASYAEFDERVAGIGKDLVRQSVQQSMRETAKDIPFVYSTINQDTFIARLFRDSLGNTAEEEFNAAKVAYSTNELAEWKQVSGALDFSTNGIPLWDRFIDHIHPRYGVRWNYAYVAYTIGKYLGKPVVFTDIRYHYGNISLIDPYETDIEVLLSMPLGNKTLCTVGMIQHINPPEWDRRWSFKVSQKVDGGRIFIGFTLREESDHENMTSVIGFERPW